MKFLCLAYGAEKDWQELSDQQQREFLAEDDALRQGGALVSAVSQEVTTVTAWSGSPVTSRESFAQPGLPLAGFSIIEAADIREAVKMVSGTPCARAKGAIEIRALSDQ
ncbi:YciI family protein [Cellvibrio polysaccharolyticus]|uniref:YCII-related domain-containing protein n=1 Tax=Cellvibrio polysaccharolyticus TaxID=2082724 RepID=A0A928V254_9GAMM|nr:YciI family protein [Cellvibrio polysaccharolyticus]MBE8715775.1 hypothetical protein [Cellvibrio polysaccharolyticus]